ncbi:MAG TPA: methyl-accepting chemotaxis protein, partial [Candidatus Methylomirabilis sp.]|nr:methyl-accepting chemotaxis protein [Candidatus Methylomirabilis sp.]
LATRVKLFLGFGLMMIFLAGVIATAYTGITAVQGSQKRLYNEDFATASDLLTLRTELNGVRAALLMMVWMTKRSDQEAWHQDVKDRTKEIDERIARLLDRGRNDPKLLRGLEELQTLWNAFRQTRDTQLIPLIYKGKIEEAKKLALDIQAERYLKFRSIAKKLGDEAVEQARRRVAESEQRVNESLRIFMVVGLIALLMGVAMAVFLTRIIANPLKEISGIAELMASGDLTVTVPSDTQRDEVGILRQTFRKMVENLREITRQLREGIGVLASSASEILTATTQVASSTAETAAAVNETTTTVEEVKQTAQVSSQKAKYVSDTAQKVGQVSQSGLKSVESSTAGMHRIREQMESIAESILRLSEQSQAIGEIIATVNDLAEQSNLLAVNAAIEAAKSGEHGKGFAVVAQEVKSLAGQSRQATAQVRTILNDIQKATSAAVMATEQGSKAVSAGVTQSAEAGEAIRLLAGSIMEAAQAAAQIAASSQQQLAGTDQVVLAMENIKQASAQNVTGTKQAETAAQSLHELGKRLKQLVEQYKV